MMGEKRIYKVLVVLVMFSCLTVGAVWSEGAQEESTVEPIIIKATHVNAPDHPVGLGIEKFKALVEERTNGAIKVNTFHRASLGNAREIIEGTQLNTIQIASTNIGILESFAPAFDIFSMPFLFRDMDHLEAVINSDLTDLLAQEMDKLNLYFVGFSSSGARHIYTKKPVESVDDLRGLKIRAMSVDTIIDYLEEVGAEPVPLGFGEVYTALQTGAIDGAESNIISWYRMKHFEGAPYIAMINYMDSGNAYFASKKFMDSLSEAHRKIVEESFIEAIKGVNDTYRQQQEEIEKEIAPSLDNANVTYPDRSPFVKAAEQVWKANPPTLGVEWIEKIRAMQ